MPGYVVQSQRAVTDGGGAATTVSVTLTGVHSGNTIAVDVGWEDVSGTVTCTVADSKGRSYVASPAGKVRDAGNTQSGEAFYLQGATSGDLTITATFSASESFLRIRAVEIGGVDANSSVQGASQAQTTPGTTANAVSSGNVTTTVNSFCVGSSQDTSETNPGTGTVSAGTSAGAWVITPTAEVILPFETLSRGPGTFAATFTQSVNNSRITHILTFREDVSYLLPRTERRRSEHRRSASDFDRLSWVGAGVNPGAWFERDLVMPVSAGADSNPALADSGAGTDAATIAATIAASDAGTGNDVADVSAALAPTDTSSGSETAALLASQGLSDSASGIDSTALAATIAGADAASGTDAVAVTVDLQLSDSATGTDGITVDTGGTPVPITDSGTGSDSVDIAAGISGLDAGAGGDVADVGVALTASDSSSGADSIAAAVALSPADTSSGSDVFDLLVAAGLSDSAVGSDSIIVDTGSPDKDLALGDSGVGSDAILVDQQGEAAPGGGPAARFELADYAHIIKPMRLHDGATGASWIRVDRFVGVGQSLQVELDLVMLPPRLTIEQLALADNAVGRSQITVHRLIDDPYLPLLRSSPRLPLRRSATK